MKQEKIPELNPLLCTQCGTCIAACPQQAIVRTGSSQCAKCMKYCISLEVNCHPDYLVFIYEHCNSCGLCIETCPADAISWHTIKQKRIQK